MKTDHIASWADDDDFLARAIARRRALGRECASERTLEELERSILGNSTIARIDPLKSSQEHYIAKCEEISGHPAFEPLAAIIKARRAVHPEHCEYDVAVSLLSETVWFEGKLYIAGFSDPAEARQSVIETATRYRGKTISRGIIKRNLEFRGIMWRYWQREKLLIADLLEDSPPDSVKEIWEMIRANVVQLRPLEPAPIAENKPKEKGFHFAPLSEISDEPFQYRIAGMVPQDGITVIFGKPKSGKTFAAIDMASCVATGRDYHGHAVKPGKVVYIAGEGRQGIKARFTAWATHYGADPMNNVLLSSGAAMIGVQTHLAQVAQAIHAATRGETPAMIVVDTLKRNFGPGNEDKGEDMSRFVAGLDRLRELFPGTTVIVVHHSGHHDDERAMGSINLLAAVDAEYRAKKMQKDRMKLECTNSRDFEGPENMLFDMVKVASALVPVYSGASAERTKQRSKAEQIAIDSFNAIPAEKMTDTGAPEELWRQAFYDRYSGKDDAKEKAFQRVRKALRDKGELFEVEGYCLVDV